MNTDLFGKKGNADKMWFPVCEFMQIYPETKRQTRQEFELSPNN